MKYVYLGDRVARAYESPYLGRPCDPVLRPDGKCIVGGSKQLVTFDDGQEVVVMRRMLRVVARP
jgi:hypothetical protein